MEPSFPLQVLSIRSSLPHLRVIVLYGDEEVPAEVTKQYHMSPKPFEHPICPLDHNDGQFFRAMEWLMFFFRPPLPSMVFQWF